MTNTLTLLTSLLNRSRQSRADLLAGGCNVDGAGRPGRMSKCTWAFLHVYQLRAPQDPQTHRCSLPSLGTCCGWDDANPGSEEGSKLWQTGHGGKAADETGHKKHANSPAWLHGLHQEGLLLGPQHQRAGMGALGCMAACTMARISCSLWGLVRVSVSRGASARRWFASTTSSDSPACVIRVSSQKQGCIRQAKCGVGCKPCVRQRAV